MNHSDRRSNCSPAAPTMASTVPGCRVGTGSQEVRLSAATAAANRAKAYAARTPRPRGRVGRSWPAGRPRQTRPARHRAGSEPRSSRWRGRWRSPSFAAAAARRCPLPISVIVAQFPSPHLPYKPLPHHFEEHRVAQGQLPAPMHPLSAGPTHSGTHTSCGVRGPAVRRWARSAVSTGCWSPLRDSSMCG